MPLKDSCDLDLRREGEGRESQVKTWGLERAGWLGGRGKKSLDGVSVKFPCQEGKQQGIGQEWAGPQNAWCRIDT